MSITSPAGEIWRIVATGGSDSLDIRFTDVNTQLDLIVQVLAVDGIASTLTQSMTGSTLSEIAGNKFKTIACPGVLPVGVAKNPGSALCVTGMLMMPSSRVDVWVTYRNPVSGVVQAPGPAGAQVIMRTNGVQTGPSGDSWPAMGLASLSFAPLAVHSISATMPDVLSVVPASMSTLTTSVAAAKTPSIPADQHKQQHHSRTQTSSDDAFAPVDPGPDSLCQPLPRGYRRRVFFNVPWFVFLVVC